MSQKLVVGPYTVYWRGRGWYLVDGWSMRIRRSPEQNPTGNLTVGELLGCQCVYLVNPEDIYNVKA